MGQEARRYEIPAGTDDHVKDIVDIFKTEILHTEVQLVRNGGETNLHAHNGVDSVWFVLGGTAAFYDENEKRTVLQKHETILLPSGTKYWFESVGDETLEIMHIVARDVRVEASRNDVNVRPERVGGPTPHYKAPEVTPVSV